MRQVDRYIVFSVIDVRQINDDDDAAAAAADDVDGKWCCDARWRLHYRNQRCVRRDADATA